MFNTKYNTMHLSFACKNCKTQSTHTCSTDELGLEGSALLASASLEKSNGLLPKPH